MVPNYSTTNESVLGQLYIQIVINLTQNALCNSLAWIPYIVHVFEILLGNIWRKICQQWTQMGQLHFLNKFSFIELVFGIYIKFLKKTRRAQTSPRTLCVCFFFLFVISYVLSIHKQDLFYLLTIINWLFQSLQQWVDTCR